MRLSRQQAPVAEPLTPQDVRIITCCHKQCTVPNDAYLLPMHVGAALHDYDLPFQRDDQLAGKSCDNISAKNATYCELTALYWMWKNLREFAPDVRYVGLCHYRRYFMFDRSIRMRNRVVFEEDAVLGYAVDAVALTDLLAKYDAITLRPLHYPYSNFVHYANRHLGDDMRKLIGVVHDSCPDADEAMFQTLMLSNTLAPCNMFVMSWEHCAEYCTWLFALLAEIEERIDLAAYSPYQRRIFGFLAERLMNVWLTWREFDIATVPMAAYGTSGKESLLKERVNDLRWDTAYRLGRVKSSRSRSEFDGIIVSQH